MRRALMTILVITAVISLWAETYFVPADFETIQGAIRNVADGDVIIVSPGIYWENINFLSMSIIVGSFYYTTQDTSYIAQTVINGSASGSVVQFDSGEDSTSVLSGFTITNGYVSSELPEDGGGGICCRFTSPSLQNLIITGNTAGFGGGIYCYENSTVHLMNVLIENNTANLAGGGMCLYQNSSAVMEGVRIYNNEALGFGSEQHPQCGGGIYSDIDCSLEIDNVIVAGNTALGGGGLMLLWNAESFYENLTVENNTAGIGGGIYILVSEIHLNNSILESNTADIAGGLFCAGNRMNDRHPTFNNVTVANNRSSRQGAGMLFDGSIPIMTNMLIEGNCCYGIDYSMGGGMYFRASNPWLRNVVVRNNSVFYFGGGIYLNEFCEARLENVQITDNEAYHSGGGIGVYNAAAELVNVTIAENRSQDYGGGLSSYQSSTTLVNCIFWNNLPGEIYLEDYENNPGEMNIAYSDVSGGEAGVVVNDNHLNWLGHNIDADPLFMDIINGDYHLESSSPCVDAGTDYFIYEDEVLVDLSEEQYWGSDPDLGAYEYFSDDSAEAEILPVGISMHNFPNPFNPETRIYFELQEPVKVKLSVYNVKGQLAEELINDNLEAGEHDVVWDASRMSSGVYLVRLQAGVETTVGKVLLLK
ncbi:MAG: T9SS type A sorting domain-containing protein [Candidatus Cloacimonetes bacterium]|nr:T9SS type A sorting domain-containing protein [Candidatus Cloacimonadota bacterium]